MGHKNKNAAALAGAIGAVAFGALIPDSPAEALEVEGRKSVTAPRLSAKPVIDGRIDEPLWAQAAVIDDLRQIRPTDGAPASERTEVLVAYDADNLYIAVRLFDSRGQDAITANIMRQGSRLGEDDRIGIILDPFNSARTGYRFEVNLNSVRNDMLYQGPTQFTGDWTVIWEAQSVRTDYGWSLEIAIPFKTLPFDPSVEAWGFNISRAIRGRGEEAIWVSRNRSWGPAIVGELRGLKDVDQGVGLDVVPSVGIKHLRDDANDRDTTLLEPSIDAYYRITPSLNASITVNTDFSATELDDRQVNLTRFGLFFPEKRDFFLNDSDVFEFGRIGVNGYFGTTRSATRARAWRAAGRSSRGASACHPPARRWTSTTAPNSAVASGAGASVHSPCSRTTTCHSPARATTQKRSVSCAHRSTCWGVERRLHRHRRRSRRQCRQFALWFRLPVPEFTAARRPQCRSRGLVPEVADSRHSGRAAGCLGHRRAHAERARAARRLLDEGDRFAVPARHGFREPPRRRATQGDVGWTHIVNGPRLQLVYAGIDAERIAGIGGPLQTQVITLKPLEFESRARDIFRSYIASTEEHLFAPFTIYQDVRRRVTLPAGSYKATDWGFDLETGIQRKVAGHVTYRQGDFYDGKRLTLGGDLLWRPSRFIGLKVAYTFNDIELPVGDFSTRILAATAEVNFSSRLSWITLMQYDNVSELGGMQSRLQWVPKAGQKYFLVLNHGVQDFDKDGHFDPVSTELAARAGYTWRF